MFLKEHKTDTQQEWDMKNYEVHFYNEVEGDGTHLSKVPLPDTPPIGTILIIPQVTKTRSFSRGVGVVRKVVMSEGSELITLFVQDSLA